MFIILSSTGVSQVSDHQSLRKRSSLLFSIGWKSQKFSLLFQRASFFFFFYLVPLLFLQSKHISSGWSISLSRTKLQGCPLLWGVLWAPRQGPHKKHTGRTSRWKPAPGSVVGRSCTSTIGSKFGSWLWKMKCVWCQRPSLIWKWKWHKITILTLLLVLEKSFCTENKHKIEYVMLYGLSISCKDFTSFCRRYRFIEQSYRFCQVLLIFSKPNFQIKKDQSL